MGTKLVTFPVVLIGLILNFGALFGTASDADGYLLFDPIPGPTYTLFASDPFHYFTYDAATDHFGSSPIFGFLGRLSADEMIFGSGGPTFDAIIDESGHVISGSALWVGGIPQLGIPGGTTLLTGTMTAVDFCVRCTPGAPGTQFSILFDVDYVNPALGSLGPIAGVESAGVAFVDQYPYVNQYQFVENPFRSSFTYGLGSYVGMYNASPTPEPSSLLLLGSGLAGLGGMAWRRHRKG